MNSKPIFHIFGVPDGFDILNGTPDITPYFQCYYNRSEENTKFSIHRDSNGNITYAYLKYNLSSYQSRTGSFFGMSLTFSNEYCTDPMTLYELFDSVYVNKVLGCSADKGLLQKIEVESKIQARYLIPNFGSAKDYIQQEIKFVLQNNITKEFANSFQPISVRFKNDQSHLVAQIPFADANNKKIISLLHTYNRIAISPDWEPKPPTGGQTPPPSDIVIAPETIKFYDESVKDYQSYLIDSLANVKAANINNARQVQAEIESVLKDLRSGTSTDQCLPQLINDYKVLSGQFAELIQKIKDSSGFPPPPIIPWWKRYLPYLFGVAVLVIFVVVLSNEKEKIDPDLSNSDDTPNVSSPHVEDTRVAIPEQDALNRIADLLHDNEWNDAWQVAERIEKSTLKNEKQSEILDKCEVYFTDKVNNAQKTDAQGILDEIKGLKVDYGKKKEHINKLDRILNSLKATDSGGTGSTGSTDKQGTKKFAIEMQLASSVSENLGDHDRAKRIDDDYEINLDNFSNIVFCLINAESGAPINDKNDKKYFQSSTVKFRSLKDSKGKDTGWYVIEKTTARNNQLIFESTNKSEKITITFK